MRDGVKDGLKEDFRDRFKDGFRDEVKDEWMDLVIDLPSGNRFRSRCMFSELNSIDAAWIQRCIGAFIRTFPMDLEWLLASRHILARAWL